MMRCLRGMLIVLVCASCEAPRPEPASVPTSSSSERPLVGAFAVSSTDRVVFLSYRPDVATHLNEVLAGQHGSVKLAGVTTVSDQWYMAILPEGLFPSQLDQVTKYDLAAVPNIKLKLRTVNPVFGKDDNSEELYMGTLICDSGTAEVHGEIELTGPTVVSEIKQTSYPGGGSWGFKLFLQFSGFHGNRHLNAEFRLGSLFNMPPSDRPNQ